MGRKHSWFFFFAFWYYILASLEWKYYPATMLHLLLSYFQFFFSKLKYFVNFSQKLISGCLWVSALVFRLTFVVWIEFERKLNSGIDIPITTTKIVFLHNLSIVNYCVILRNNYFFFNNKFTFGLALQSSTLVNWSSSFVIFILPWIYLYYTMIDSVPINSGAPTRAKRAWDRAPYP